MHTAIQFVVGLTPDAMNVDRLADFLVNIHCIKAMHHCINAMHHCINAMYNCISAMCHCINAMHHKINAMHHSITLNRPTRKLFILKVTFDAVTRKIVTILRSEHLELFDEQTDSFEVTTINMFIRKKQKI